MKEYYEDEKIEPMVLDSPPDRWMSFDEFLDMSDGYMSGNWYKYGDIYYHGIE